MKRLTIFEPPQLRCRLTTHTKSSEGKESEQPGYTRKKPVLWQLRSKDEPHHTKDQEKGFTTNLPRMQLQAPLPPPPPPPYPCQKAACNLAGNKTSTEISLELLLAIACGMFHTFAIIHRAASLTSKVRGTDLGNVHGRHAPRGREFFLQLGTCCDYELTWGLVSAYHLSGTARFREMHTGEKQKTCRSCPRLLQHEDALRQTLSTSPFFRRA